MTVIVCVDDDFGMSFCSKRQSMDSKLRIRVLDSIKDGFIYMNEYTFSQFDENTNKIKTADNFNNINGTCFLESPSLIPDKEKIDKIILYKWNRRYPSTEKFDATILKDYKLESSFDFVGNSHEKITEEIYVR